MINENETRSRPALALPRLRAAARRVAELLADSSQSMRCAREAERLQRMSDVELYRLGVRRQDIVRHAFAGHVGH
ncbi:MAG: hypothetical protein DI556_17910 [Rhodovulum sulfidophilum]|uniref:DUF1127 domain-containing protein n=1 Tax=Rhodovulum sulfidophilum TaxID=35806 RepID=A0A2W5N1K7_RHOSU|nr:MAG: hypothetical protein DI556_17910 [Rhodovulum sulfidophilum]